MTVIRTSADEKGVYLMEIDSGDGNVQSWVPLETSQRLVSEARVLSHEQNQVAFDRTWDALGRLDEAQKTADAAIELCHQLWIYAEALQDDNARLQGYARIHDFTGSFVPVVQAQVEENR